MKVIEFSQPGDPDVLYIGVRPKPSPRKSEVLIRVLACGVNRPDILQRRGFYAPPPDAFDVLGLEVAGIIDCVGEDVKDWRAGDSVCALVHGGGYAEYCLADQGCVLPIPQGLTYVEAASLPEVCFTVWYNVFELGGLEADERILIHGGSSGVGTAAIQFAKSFGAWVATTVSCSQKADYCRSLGADCVINYETDDISQCIKAQTDGKGVNLVLDIFGGQQICENIKCLADKGRHISIAFIKDARSTINIMEVMHKRLVLSGSTLRPRSREEKAMIAESLSLFIWPLIDLGQIKPKIFETFAFADVAKAHSLMESRKHSGKIVLDTASP